MYATVVAVDGDDVMLEVAPDVEVRYMKRAIMEVVSPGDEPAEDETYDDEPETYDADAEHDEPASTRTAWPPSTKTAWPPSRDRRCPRR